MLPYSPQEPVEPKEPQIQEFKNPVAAPKHHKGLAIVSGTLAVIALAGAAFAYYYFFLQKPLPNINLALTAPDSVLLGDPFELELNFANDSDQVIRNATVNISFPEGVVALGGNDSQRFWEENFGDIEPGAYGKRTLKFLVIGNPETIKRFEGNLRYSVTNDSGSQFRSSISKDVAVGAPAISANFSVPDKVMSGQDFSIRFNYRNNSRSKLTGVKLILDYPAKFELREASSTPELTMEGDNTWIFGDLEPGASGSIDMWSGFTGEAGFFSIGAKITAVYDGHIYTIWSDDPSVSVSQAPLSLEIQVNGSKNAIARPGSDLLYRLIYKNNSSVPLQNAFLEATLNGTMLEYSRLRTTGTFNSVANKLAWNSAAVPALANIGPGDTGYVEFSVPLKQSFAIRRVSDKNFSVKAQATIESPTVPPGVDAAKTISAASSEVKISGDIALASLAYYYEPAASGIKNTGPYPPRLNKPTQFTIHWRLINSATDMKDVWVRTKLPAGTTFTGAVKSSEESKPVYDSQTGEVSWHVPVVAATRGIVGAPAEAIFQVEVIPAINQVGQNLILTTESSLKAKDAWTGGDVSKTAPAEDTHLEDDPKAGDDGRVKN